jgi:hypothetical protein
MLNATFAFLLLLLAGCGASLLQISLGNQGNHERKSCCFKEADRYSVRVYEETEGQGFVVGVV